MTEQELKLAEEVRSACIGFMEVYWGLWSNDNPEHTRSFTNFIQRNMGECPIEHLMEYQEFRHDKKHSDG